MKKTRPEQIGELVDRLLNEYGIADKAKAHKASMLWQQIVGEAINRYTTRRKVDGTVLHVWIMSAALKNELLFKRAEICRAINNELGEQYLTEIQLH